jgi:hypothetical protein
MRARCPTPSSTTRPVAYTVGDLAQLLDRRRDVRGPGDSENGVLDLGQSLAYVERRQRLAHRGVSLVDRVGQRMQ